jgi:hypothetical protein
MPFPYSRKQRSSADLRLRCTFPQHRIDIVDLTRELEAGSVVYLPHKLHVVGTAVGLDQT